MTAMATELQEQPQPTRPCRLGLCAWTRQQAEALLRFQATCPNPPIDLAHLIDEMDGSANNNFFASESRLRQILIDFRKLSQSPAAAPRRKRAVSIMHAEAEIDGHLTPTNRHGVVDEPL